MILFKRFFFIALFSLIFTSICLSRTYYVDDSTGNNSNNGTSLSTAWKTLSKVNSARLLPGDIVLLKRDGIWNETIIIKHSGTPQMPIIFGSYGSGELPVIDVSGSKTNCILIYNKKNIVIREIRMTGTSAVEGSGAVRIRDSKQITVKDCEFMVTGRAAVYVEESSNCEIIKNTINTPAKYYKVQTDGIYAYKNSNNIYDGNKIIISNKHTSQQCDGIQLNKENYAVICNNYIEQNNTKSTNAQGISASFTAGTTRIYNNICIGQYSSSGLIKFKSSFGTAEVIGNTIYGGKGNLFITDDPYIIFKNNIIQTTSSYLPVCFEKLITNKKNINYNLYRRLGKNLSIIKYAGKSTSMEKWQKLGFDVNGIEADPQFTSPLLRDFTLKNTSPALDVGEMLSSPYNSDRMGYSRPFGSGSDIGAYENAGIIQSKNLDLLDIEQLPEKIGIVQNYPNPFNPLTRIHISIPYDQEINVKVYDIIGNIVSELASGVFKAGSYDFNFDGSTLSSGTYVCVLSTGTYVESKKMTLIK